MAQSLALKAEAEGCLLFYRMGDFFELFFDDAAVAAECLDIALTARGEHEGEKVPMCGVPVHSADAYLARLIRAGHKVAIAEQVERPEVAKKERGHKALVRRAIVRIVSAGTLTEETLLDARRANWLVALARAGERFGVAAADISTGAFELGSVTEASLEAELARLGAAEIIANSELAGAQHRQAGFDSLAAERALKARFGVSTLDGFGHFDRAALAAAGGLLAYLEESARGALNFLRPPVLRETGDHMLIDATTRESLELTRSMGGGTEGSLLAEIRRTVTGAGGRLLEADLGAPLTDRKAIEARLDLVSMFERDAALREEVRARLRAAPDSGRALGRLAAARGGPRDLAQLRDALEEAGRLRDRLARVSEPPPLLATLLPALADHGEMVDLLARALVAAPEADTSRGGYIAEGYDAALDAMRASAGEGQRALVGLEQRYREETGITTLRIRLNAVLGYHIEVPARHADRLMRGDSGFTHRQTLAGVVRFNSVDLHEQARQITEAGSNALAVEQSHLERLIAAALARAGPIAAAADALARLDVAAANAERSLEGGWARPQLGDDAGFEVIGGRHPVVERALRGEHESFVANDCRLDDGQRLWLVTGPNMGGKSTFLRQNALIAILAQAGCHVPATSARLGIVDRLFSRVGASDNLARGRSTFMVEMVETAAILRQAGPRSFVILDEVGRGTSTYDGLAIAWAVVEAIHDRCGCRCLFATHYHELTRLAERLDNLTLHHVRAREWKGELVLLHEVAEGPADRSFGIAVAKLAGLPDEVVVRSRSVLAKLEAGRAATGGIAAGLDDLPLFAATAPAPSEVHGPLLAELDEAQPDALTPREALELVYRLKRLRAEQSE
ncbi:MAG: DNA mismatch repair protein MutS [Sphingosinicella sp.]